jgi:hypothetical protein
VLSVTVAAEIADREASSRTPDAASIESAVVSIRRAFRPGDAIRVEPSWWTLPWSGLVGLGQGTDTWPFPSLLTSEEIDPLSVLGHERLLLLTGFGRLATLPPLIADAATLEGTLFSSETLTATSWAMTPLKRLRTLSAEWDHLRVTRRLGHAPPVDCRLSAGKHRCGRESWLDVALESRVVARREVQWLFVHPGPSGDALSVHWTGLTRSGELGPTWLFVRVGPSLEAVRHPEGGPVTVEVLVDGNPMDRFIMPPRRFEMERRAIALPQGQGDADVEFRISCNDNPWRETMLEADLLDRLPTTLRRWATAVVDP